MKPFVTSGFSLSALLATTTLLAVDYNNNGGNQYWGNSTNWTAAFPDATGASARMLTNSSGTNQILVLADSSGADASFTVGSFTIGSSSGAPVHNYRLNNVASGAGRLIFDASSGNASLTFTNIFADATMSVNTGVLLKDNLSITIGRGSGSYSIYGKISSDVAGTGLLVNGPGTVQIGGANDYTGATTINSGTLKLISGNDRLTTSTALTINGGASSAGTLDLNTRNQKVGSLNGGSGTTQGVVINRGAGTGTATLTVESTTASSIFSGVIKDGTTAKVALTKAGAGTSLTLTGINTYTGATTVDGGSLIVDGSLDAGSVVAINSGGTLGGSGTIGGVTTLAAGSKLSAGDNSAATLTFSGTLDLAAAANDSAAFVFSLGTSSDKIVTGSLALGTNVLDAADFTLSAGAGFAGGQTYTLFENSSVSGSFLAFLITNIDGSGIDGTVALDGENIVLTTSAIPEPSTHAVLLGGAALLAVGVVRRRR